MAVLLDAYALVALLRGEPAAEPVANLIRDEDVALTSLNLAETIDVLHRREQMSMEVIRRGLVPLLRARVRTRAIGFPIAWRGAELRRKHYRRGTSELSLADCLLVAAASSGDRVATADPPLAAMARAEGVEVVLLPAAG